MSETEAFVSTSAPINLVKSSGRVGNQRFCSREDPDVWESGRIRDEDDENRLLSSSWGELSQKNGDFLELASPVPGFFMLNFQDFLV